MDKGRGNDADGRACTSSVALEIKHAGDVAEKWAVEPGGWGSDVIEEATFDIKSKFEKKQ